MKRLSLVFAAPGRVELREEKFDPPGSGRVLVATAVSAISAGTELLFYGGQVPAGMAVDDTIAGMAGPARYPLKYGYACAGTVTAAGAGAGEWLGRRVFALHPHESRFIAAPGELVPLPEGMGFETAVLLPFMETAVNFMLDGAPLMGERVAVFGQGVVGLMTTALLARFPLESLVTFDRYPARRKLSVAMGAGMSLDPDAGTAACWPAGSEPAGADLVYELSGNPAALNLAVETAGFGGRVVIGSWYGDRPATLSLGGRFHRDRVRILSSQVSTIDPARSGRWDRGRRTRSALSFLRALDLRPLVTHRLPFDRAAEAYELVARRPGEVLQALLIY